jgi:hypothetical protein
MALIDQEDFDVAELEAELFDARTNERDVFLEVTIDQNVTLRRRDQIVCEALAADVVQVADDPERWKRFDPVSGRLLLSVCRTSDGDNSDDKARDSDERVHGQRILSRAAGRRASDRVSESRRRTRARRDSGRDAGRRR